MADILTPPTGGYGTTLSDGSPYVMIPKVINASWNKGLEFQATYSAKVTAVQSTYLDAANAPHVSTGSVAVPTVSEPNVVIPPTQSAGDVISMFDTKYNELINRLVLEFTTFRSNYFPNEGAVYSAAESALADCLANPDKYIPAAVAAQIWGDDQARIISDKLRAQNSVVAQFAGRRFPLPPAVEASAILQIEQKAQDELAESSRKVAIMSVDQFKFVVEKVINLRSMAMESAVKYIMALASGPDMATKLVGVGYDAQSKLITSASAFYNARTQAAELVSKVQQYNNSTALEAAVKNQAADLALIEQKVNTLLAEARELAQLATAMFNNLHVQASISGSSGNNVSYSYSNDTNSNPPSLTAA